MREKSISTTEGEHRFYPLALFPACGRQAQGERGYQEVPLP